MRPPCARLVDRSGRGTREPPPRPGRAAGGPPPVACSPRLRRPEDAVERRPREDLRQDVVQIEVNLREGADVLADVVVDRNDRLEPELEIPPEPDDPRVHGAGRAPGVS